MSIVQIEQLEIEDFLPEDDLCFIDEENKTDSRSF